MLVNLNKIKILKLKKLVDSVDNNTVEVLPDGTVHLYAPISRQSMFIGTNDDLDIAISVFAKNHKFRKTMRMGNCEND